MTTDVQRAPALDAKPRRYSRARTCARGRAVAARIWAGICHWHVSRSAVVADLRRAWWVVTKPPTLGEWWRSLRPDPLAVPGGSPLIRWAWIVDSYTTGLALGAVSILLHAAGAATRWTAGHPLRRWSFITIVAATLAALITL